MMPPKKRVRGTREWAVANIDCCTGCTHGCRYCYAFHDAVVKKGLVTDEQWQTCRIRDEDVDRLQPRYPGQVMFPTTHDIVPENLDACLQVIANLLKAENRVLIVSKPHLDCITTLCDTFKDSRESLLFRFTITAMSDAVLSYWEPGAPGYDERLACLELAFRRDFQTSVSVEPMLDSSTVVEMVKEFQPFVTHSIWLGKMNKISTRVKIDSEEMAAEIERIRAGQSDERIVFIYKKLKDNPLVFWKESIKEVVGLDLVSEPGLDR